MAWSRYAWTRVLATSVDIFFAAIVWRHYDVTISSLTGLALRRPNPPWWAERLGAFLNWVQPNHCELAIASDAARARAAIELLSGHAP